jgi:hypothetical protein
VTVRSRAIRADVPRLDAAVVPVDTVVVGRLMVSTAVVPWWNRASFQVLAASMNVVVGAPADKTLMGGDEEVDTSACQTTGGAPIERM